MLSTFISTVHPLNGSPQKTIKSIQSECKCLKNTCFWLTSKVHSNIHFLEFFSSLTPGSTPLLAHVLLTINSIINNIRISRHCCQQEAFSMEVFESWMGLENQKMELIYTVGELRGNWCSPLFLLLCGKILTFVVFSPPPSPSFKNKCETYKNWLILL